MNNSQYLTMLLWD